MITIPASILLAIFLLIGLIFVVMILANLYHGYRFGRNDPMTMGVNTAFLGLVIAVVVLTTLLLLPVNWTQSFRISLPGANIPVPGSSTDFGSIFPR